MLFNSFEFALFLPIVFLLYWFVTQSSLTVQNLLIVLASYFFYGWWDWRFLSLIFISSLADFLIGKRLYQSQSKRHRKQLLTLSMTINLGILGFFKYFNFFADSLAALCGELGLSFSPFTLNIILPVGISFYTFQTMSYTIDIYNRRMAATDDPIAFFAFVSFFPQLVAGPIERASRLLPQFTAPRYFEYHKASDGLRQICWGLFKKLVIADNCAVVVDIIFENHATLDGSALLLGAFLFSFQIYGDFSGYSDIAIGTAKLFGIELMQNFATPYFSRNIGEFWRRWHISLSTWFRDYVYIPLGGSRESKYRQFFNIIVTFTLSGLWHGANWTFIAWGFINGLYYMPLMLFGQRQKFKGSIVAKGRLLPNIKEIFQVVTTFFFTVIAWVFFRSETITDAFFYLKSMLSMGIFRHPGAGLAGYGIKFEILYCLAAIFVLTSIEWFQRGKAHGLMLERNSLPLRVGLYTTVMMLILLFRNTGQNLDFIYFQF
ncbi:MAG: MBOAT family O-acyltransferase [Desulfobacteraceae bacterium]